MKKLALTFFMMMGIGMATLSAQTSQAAKLSSEFTIADSASFTGKYKYEDLPFEYMEVSVKDGKLYFVGGEYNGFLEPIKDKKDTFDVNGVAVFTFVRDKENKVAELKVDYEGKTYLGKKEDKKS